MLLGIPGRKIVSKVENLSHILLSLISDQLDKNSNFHI